MSLITSEDYFIVYERLGEQLKELTLEGTEMLEKWKRSKTKSKEEEREMKFISNQIQSLIEQRKALRIVYMIPKPIPATELA